jgi:CheY-like chemotaxis protein
VDAALDVLDQGDITFALLDVNLGRETSLAVAEQVWSDGIPAVLATGYGAQENLLRDFPPLPVLSKPFSIQEIRDVLRHFREINGG